MTIAKITGTLINNRIWIPENNNGQNIAVVSSEVDDFKRYVFDNLKSGYSYSHIQGLKDINGKHFNGCIILGECNLTLINEVEKRLV